MDIKEKTPNEWLELRKWRKFLMSIPFCETAKGYKVNNANDLNLIRVTASNINTQEGSDRTIAVGIDYETCIVTIKVSRK